MSKDDYDLLEKAILSGSSMDAEVLSVLQRRPRVFHLGMLPTCQPEQTSDLAAAEINKAHSEASAARFKLFEAELKADWQLLEETECAKKELKELLQWLELEHRRNQAQLGATLVRRRLDKTHPILSIDSWDTLPAQLALLCRAWDGDLQDGTRRTILWVDFNTPHSRDTLKMPGLIQCLANACKMLGPESTVVYAWMPNYSREDSPKGPDEDEVDITNFLKRAGFGLQKRVRMLLSLHTSVANKTSGLDWFADGRLAVLGSSADTENVWILSSELSRTRTVAERPQLPLSRDLVCLSSLDADEDINQEARAPDLTAKCAQRGPNVAQAQLEALLAKMPLKPKDETVIVDLLPYVGDRAIGSFQYARSPNAENLGRVRHVIVKMAPKGKEDRGAVFTERRLTNLHTKEWLSRTLVLHDVLRDSRGESEVPVHPCDTVPAPTDEQLRSIRGGVAAYKGLSALTLHACFLRGSKVKIQPSKISQFDGAPLDVQDQLEALLAAHTKEYEDILSKHEEVDSSDVKGDARAGAGEVADQEPVSPDLSTYESEESLKSKVNITHTAKAIDRSITLMKDDKENYFILAAKDCVLNMGAHLGGVGGGSVVAEDTDSHRCWPWCLPKGDKTWVQCNRSAAEGEEKSAPKVVAGTLYSIVRDLEAGATGPPKLSSFGALLPAGTAGRHEYRFEHPRDVEQHEKLAFVPSPGTPPHQSSHPQMPTHVFARAIQIARARMARQALRTTCRRAIVSRRRSLRTHLASATGP